MAPDEGRNPDAHVVRQLVSRLAVVAVQGEQLQALCDELEPLLRLLRREPQLAPAAEILAGAMKAVAGVAADIAHVTDTLGRSLQRTEGRGPD
jgi:ABC-type transporter Mla subunit MlaD